MAILVVAGILQTALSPFLSLNYIHPDLLLVVIIAWSVLRDFEEAIPFAFAGGVILDILTTTPFGIFTAGLLLVSLGAGFWRDRLSYGSFVLTILLVLPYSIIFYLVVLVLMWMVGYPVAGLGKAFSSIVFPASLMNVGVMILLYPLLRWLDRLDRKDDLTI